MDIFYLILIYCKINNSANLINRNWELQTQRYKTQTEYRMKGKMCSERDSWATSLLIGTRIILTTVFLLFEESIISHIEIKYFVWSSWCHSPKKTYSKNEDRFTNGTTLGINELGKWTKGMVLEGNNNFLKEEKETIWVCKRQVLAKWPDVKRKEYGDVFRVQHQKKIERTDISWKILYIMVSRIMTFRSKIAKIFRVIFIRECNASFWST